LAKPRLNSGELAADFALMERAKAALDKPRRFRRGGLTGDIPGATICHSRLDDAYALHRAPDCAYSFSAQASLRSRTRLQRAIGADRPVGGDV